MPVENSSAGLPLIETDTVAPAPSVEPVDDAERERARLASVRAHGLLDAGWAMAVGARLGGHVTFAQRLTGGQRAAVTILGETQQQAIAATQGVSLGFTERSRAVCSRILYATGPGDVFVTGDASVDPDLWDNPFVTGVSGDAGRIRFYAGAALIGREGLPLGMLCVWSTEPMTDLDAERAGHRLMPVRDSVLEVLESRRRAHDVQAARYRTGLRLDGDGAAADVGPYGAALRGDAIDEDRFWDRGPLRDGLLSLAEVELSAGSGPIDVVIDGGAVSTVFQPIVQLATAAVVGFEALTRGPVGTELESPIALLDAAREAGRLGELDWLCRDSAMRAAAASGLPSGLSWFINVEPAGLEIDCPVHLRPAIDAARAGLRVVLEVVERDVEDHITRLLHATDQARRDSWGVALDDVGAAAGSLALLPLLQPDVVKLDMSLLHAAPSATVAAITAGVRSYAERTGAVILAEGIETADQQEMATIFGATYGQGHLYGYPGPLPASLSAPADPIPLRQQPAALHGATPFEILSATISTQQGRREHLSHIATHLHSYCADGGAVLLTLFSHEDHYRDAAPVLDVLAVRNALTVCLVPETDIRRADPRHHIGPLPADSRLEQEAGLIVITPQYAAALIAHTSNQTAQDGTALVDYIYTHNRSAVIAAARAYLDHMKPGTDTYPSGSTATTDNRRTTRPPRRGLTSYLAAMLTRTHPTPTPAAAWASVPDPAQAPQ